MNILPHERIPIQGTRLSLTNVATDISDKDISGHLFVDEIYHDFVTPLGKDSAVHASDNVIIAGGLTKVYGLGTLKIGWLIGPEKLIERATISRLHQFMLIPGPSLAMATLFMKDQENIRSAQVKRIEKNRNFIVEALNEHETFIPPYGPVSTLKLNNSIDDVELAKEAIKNHGLVLSPGHFFKHPGNLRISYAGDLANIKQGIDILKKILT